MENELNLTEDEIYFEFLKENLRHSQNLAGWLQDFAPSDDYHLKFENPKELENVQHLSYWEDIVDTDYTYNNELNDVLNRRMTYGIDQLSNLWSQQEVLLLLNHALGDGSRFKNYKGIHVPLRNYPSGGAQYPVQLFLISNMETTFFQKNRAYQIHPDLGIITEVPNTHFNFEDVFAITHFNKDLSEQTRHVPFVIVMNMNLEQSFKKYKTYSKHLALIEAGHIGQNLQLIATALGKKSMPSGGILSDITKDAIGLNGSIKDVIIYGMVFG